MKRYQFKKLKKTQSPKEFLEDILGKVLLIK